MAPLDPHNHYVFNILLVGDVGVGKSSLLNALLAEKKSSDKTTAGRPTGVESNGLQYTTGGRESDEREEEGKKSEGVGKGGGYRKTGVNFKLKTIQLDGQTVKLQIWTTSDDLGFLKITSKYSKEEHGVIIMYDITDQAVAKQLGVRFLETSVLDDSKVDEIFRTMASEIKGRVVSSTSGAEVDRSDVKTAETGSIEFSSCFFKIILIGSSRVGKSRLARRLLVRVILYNM
ncbi:ras-related protein Rab-1A-like isoform X2 [Amblyomma americanum]